MLNSSNSISDSLPSNASRSVSPADSTEKAGQEFLDLLSQLKQPAQSESQAPETLHAQNATDTGGVNRTASANETPTEDPLEEAFKDFVGQTFFSQLIKSLRSTEQGAAYFDGGQGEKIFKGQLDQMLTEEISEKSSDKIAEPMFELFKLGRSR